MKIALAADHRGFKLKNFLTEFLKAKGHEVMDFGTHSSEPCDYPDYVYPAAVAVREKKADRAIAICYTGIGSSIVANKVRGVRAALVHDVKSTRLTRKHNNSNVLVLAADGLKEESVKRLVSTWLKTEFEGGRHLRRIKKIQEIEEKENV
ncbi:MAG: ribose 5-phosphate isomerase B [Candidatus Omnitrophota bacterium]|nr:MAG: ribose 5-phosphate isomerase B [Candidatus Omnitrophota bacterium]